MPFAPPASLAPRDLQEYAAGGTLQRAIASREGELFPEESVWEMFVQVVLALRYVHACNLLHRDLKTENLLLGGLNNRVREGAGRRVRHAVRVIDGGDGLPPAALGAGLQVVLLSDFGIAKVLGSQADMAATIVGERKRLGTSQPLAGLASLASPDCNGL